MPEDSALSLWRALFSLATVPTPEKIFQKILKFSLGIVIRWCWRCASVHPKEITHGIEKT